MIDDERLQELLTKASSLYNDGEYKGAIEAWREALTVDPASQKAREGIRMATLLMGEWESHAPGSPAEDPAAPADLTGQEETALSAEEQEAQIDLGIARLKQLIAQRKFSEAVEGARGLLTMSPDSEEIQRLLEEAQHAFESAPFIEEHLTLARELMAQERFPEAEAECKKIFALDAGHPEGQALLAQIRQEIQSHLSRAADQLGGMTVKMSLPDLSGASKGGPGKPGPAAGSAAKQRPGAAGPARVEEPKRAFEGEVVLDGGDEPAIALAGAEPERDGSEAEKQENVAARSVLDAAFEQAGVGLEESPSEDPSSGPSEPEAPPAPERQETVEAKTVVPPAVRFVPRSPGPEKPKAPEAVKPAAREPGPAPAPPAKPSTLSAGADETSWETELAQLNIKQGERELLRGAPVALSGTAPPDGQADADLMAILDTDMGGLPAPETAKAPASAPGETAPGGLRAGQPAEREPKLRAERRTAPGEVARPGLRERESPSPATRERTRTPPLPRPRSRGSSGRKFLMFFLVLLLAGGGGAAWWFFFQPRSAGSAGSPGQPGSKQGPGQSDGSTEGGQGGIPTPIGSTSRQPAQEARAASAGPGGDAASGQGASAPSAPGQAAAPVSAGVSGSQAATTGQALGQPKPSGPIKPETTPPLSPEEARRKVASNMDEGRKLMAQSRWREARAKLSAALALDPANFDVKDLLDQTQSKLDEQQHIDDDFESAKKFYNDKDYENALRKFYRLPRDKGLGNIDLYIRNSWFNWAAVSMKAGNATDALLKLKELLDVDPDDAQALKLQEVAEHYVSRAKDRVYYAFTDNLRLRAFDQK